MYDDEDDLNVSLPRILRVAIINPLVPKIDLSKKILEKTSYEYKERLKFTLYTNMKDIYKQMFKDLSLEEKSSKGLINIKWLEDITKNKPCLIILYYHIEENANLESEQQKIYNLLEDIKKNDNNISIFLFIIFKDNPESPYPFESEDKSKKYNLRNIINKEFIFVFPDEEIWKYFEFPNFCSNVVFFARQYYLKLKLKIKEKKSKANRIEEKIECDIMLGVLSTIKSKKIEPQESKYFEQAYNMIYDKNFDIKNYYYGNNSPPNTKLNFCEIRSIADWIFFKTFKLTKRNIKNNQNKQRVKGTSLMTQITSSESQLRIDRFLLHIKRFISISNCYYDTKKEDCFAFMEYYWLFQRYNKLGNFIKENIKELSTNKEKILYLGIVYLETIYNLIKMIKYYRKYLINKDLNLIKYKDKEIQINRLQNKKDIYYGKVPIFILKDAKNPLFKEELPFNDDIFIKKFIYDKKLTLDNLVNDLNNKYIPKTLEFFQKFNLKVEKDVKINNVYGINLYFNILINLSCLENDKDDNNIFKYPTINKNMEQINSIIHKFDYIKKFPKLYINFLNKYNQSLLYQMNTGKKFDNFQKTQLFINLSILGYHLKLNEKEEDLFFDLLNDERFIPSNKNNDKQIFINLDYNTKDNNKNNSTENNNSFIFNYSIKDIGKSQQRKILDLIEYDFNFKTNLTKEKIKFDSMKIIFRSVNETLNNNVASKNFEIIERKFSKDELDIYTLDNNTPINIHCKLFMKNKMNKLQVNKIIFSLCKKENIFYQINVKNDLSKIIFLNRLSKNILDIKYPLKKYVTGINQLFRFDFEVTKEIINDITISDFKINFESLQNFYIKETKKPATEQIKNTQNIVNNLFNPKALSFENNQFNLNSNISSLHSFPNLSSLGQQLFGQSFVNNLSMPFLFQNNINTLAVQKTKSEPTPSIQNIPNINNNINSHIPNSNPIINPTINPSINSNINPNINPNITPNINPNINASINPNIPNKINPQSNLSDRVSSYNFNGYNPLLFANPLAISPNLNLQQFNPSSSSLSQLSSTSNEIPSTQIQPSPTPNKSLQIELPPAEFFIYNEENKTIDKKEKIIEKEYKDIESLLENKKNKFSILIKFTHAGTYKIKFIVTYTLKRKDINDFYELCQENILNFEVVEPFHFKHEINSSNFLTIPQENAEKKNKKLTVFLVNNDININLILKNKLHESINITKIDLDIDKDKLKDENKNIQITSNLLEIMNLKELDQNIKDDILTILSTAEYCIPFETKFYNEFKGKIGKIKIKWTTPSLREFEKEIGDINNDLTLINENIFDFPYIIINKLELNYNYETKINDKNEIIINIKVENNTKKYKKIIFFMENGDEINFIISGKTKQTKIIKSQETINFMYKLIPLQRGELKLPSLKIWEISNNQDRICSNFYFPQKITII